METLRAMTHDENVYPEPFTFKPERFFDRNGDLDDDDRILAYGFGRRYSLSSSTVEAVSQRTTQGLCWKARRECNSWYSLYFLGAEMTPFEQLWLTFVSILASFDIGKAKDKSGKEIVITGEYEDFGLLRLAVLDLLPLYPRR